jgi:copper oxidase (laccase) domain-containing protein
VISSDQPDCFPGDITVKVSSVQDGTMLDRSGQTPAEIIAKNRTEFVESAGFNYLSCVNQLITYDDSQTYDVIKEVNQADARAKLAGVNADAIIVSVTQLGVFLPVADCVATVAYDPKTKLFAVMHLGRHSTLAKLMEKTLEQLRERGSDLADIIIWMGPSVQGTHYRLSYFTHEHEADWQGCFEQDNDGYLIDMQKYNSRRAMAMGVLEHNIHISPINTAVNDQYFSHSQGDVYGRFAVVAWRN